MDYHESRFARKQPQAILPLRPRRNIAGVLGAGLLALTACTQTNEADSQQRADARAKSAGAGPGHAYGAGIPDPNVVILNPAELERIQNRLVPAE